ncbi:MAG: hypothetical protein QOE61_735 [Micromonosporaceae bacterium]|nr:hypothetical protein [Micromonosporaceae bacterium]
MTGRTRVLDRDDVEYRQRPYLSGDDLTDAAVLGIAEGDARCGGRATLGVLANPKQDDTTGGVGHRRHIAAEVALVAVGGTAQGCLEVKIV